MAKRVVTVPLTLGRADRVDPKLAPLGVVKTCQNLRVLKDGRLGSRKGYQPLTMTVSGIGTLTAYDIHEFSNGRLIAFGETAGEGYPVDIYEYRALPANSPWRFIDGTVAVKPTLTPFTYPKQVCGIPQPAGGVTMSDCASGGGYVCIVYKPADTDFCYIQVVRESDDQVIVAVEQDNTGYESIRVCWETDRFYFVGTTDDDEIVLRSFTPSTASFSTLATIEASGFPFNTTVFEINAIGHAGTGKVIVAYGLNTGTEVKVKRFGSTGTQDGTTLTFNAGANLQSIDIEADNTDNTINVLVSQTDASVDLSTYNFSNTLLDGPTACTNGGALGGKGRVCRLPASVSDSFNEHVAVLVLTDAGVTVQWIDQDAHTVTVAVSLGQVHSTSRMVTGSSVKETTGVIFGGYVEAAQDNFSTNALFYVTSSMVHMATRDLRESARRAQSNTRPLGLSKDTSTGRIAWNTLSALDVEGDIEQPTITTLDFHTTRRRQTANSGGSMYISGAPVQMYDGHLVMEAGFNEVPRIVSNTQGTSGQLAQLATYNYVLVWEYTLPDGTFWESPPSPPFEVVMTGSNDENTLTVTSPHSARIALGSDTLMGTTVTGVLYRSVWDSVNSAPVGNALVECQRFEYGNLFSDYGDTTTVNDTASDDNISENGILYTQGGPVEHNAPSICSYIDSASNRIDVAGLVRPFEIQESKEHVLDQAVNFSNLSAFSQRVPNSINGIISLDGIRIIFTKKDIFAITGEGPNDDASGALSAPIEIASPSGLKDWRSLLKAPDGIWFQLDDNKLYRMPRGSGAPSWEGVDIQDTLATYPVITGACRHRRDDTIVFSCQNAETATDGRVIVRSLRTGLWSEDTVPLQTSKGIEAISSFGDSVAYISGGTIYQQSTSSYADNTSTVIITEIETHPLYFFELGGNGKVHDVLLTGEYRSAGTLALRISYDDGLNFTTYDSFTLSGLTTGQTIQLKWALQQSDVTSVVCEWVFTPSTAGEGFIAHNAAFLVEATGGLKDLDPEFNA
jgi:hypothetical protein